MRYFPGIPDYMLTLGKSEIASWHHPQMFPSPPSPAGIEKDKMKELQREESYSADIPSEAPNIPMKAPITLEEASDLRQHAKRLCNEDESW